MYKSLLFLLLFLSSLIFGEPFNKVVASVGDFAITSYDIESMKKFMQVYAGNTTNVKIEPLKELLYIYSLEQIVKDNKKIILPKDEIERMIDRMTNLTKEERTNQMLIERAKIVDQFPDELRLYLRKTQIIRTLLSMDNRLREKANERITEKEITNFYNEHKSSLIEPPYIDIILVVVERPNAASLDELERLEKSLEEIAKRLRKSNDISNLLEKYKKTIKFEPYSGRTGLKPVYELYQEGYPEEMLAFALTTNTITTARGRLSVKPGFVIGPEKASFKNSNKVVYFVFKLVDRKIGHPVPLDKVRSLIEAQLKEQKIMDSVKFYILDKIAKKELEIVIYDDKYKGEYDEFLRR